MKQDILHFEDKQVAEKERILSLEQQRSLKCDELEAIKVALIRNTHSERNPTSGRANEAVRTGDR